jgi:hypothetical protein
MGQHSAPWVQFGAGGYRIDLNLDEQTREGTYASVTGPRLGNVRVVPGWYGGVGFDFPVSPRVALGLDATYHYLWSRDKSWTGRNDMPDFSAWTVGMRVLFGR